MKFYFCEIFFSVKALLSPEHPHGIFPHATCGNSYQPSVTYNCMVSEVWFLRAAQSGVLQLQTTELHVPSTSVKAFGRMAVRVEVTLIHSIFIWKQREQLASPNWNDTEI